MRPPGWGEVSSEDTAGDVGTGEGRARVADEGDGERAREGGRRGGQGEGRARAADEGGTGRGLREGSRRGDCGSGSEAASSTRSREAGAGLPPPTRPTERQKEPALRALDLRN